MFDKLHKLIKANINSTSLFYFLMKNDVVVGTDETGDVLCTYLRIHDVRQSKRSITL